MLQRGLKNDHFASFSKTIWSVAGHAKDSRGRNAKEKSKALQNLKVGLPQLWTVPSVAGRFFEGCDEFKLNFAQIAPSVQLVVVFEPAFANVIAVVHVRNHDVPNPRISLCLGLPHGLPYSAHHKYHA